MWPPGGGTCIRDICNFVDTSTSFRQKIDTKKYAKLGFLTPENIKNALILNILTPAPHVVHVTNIRHQPEPHQLSVKKGVSVSARIHRSDPWVDMGR